MVKINLNITNMNNKLLENNKILENNLLFIQNAKENIIKLNELQSKKIKDESEMFERLEPPFNFSCSNNDCSKKAVFIKISSNVKLCWYHINQ